MVGDLNTDGKVNIVDVVITARAFRSTQTSPRWNLAADMKQDNEVDIIDLALIAGRFDL